MFKKRRRKIAALDRAIIRHIIATEAVENDDKVPDDFKSEALNMLEEEREVLISAAVAYEAEPATIAAAVIITSIFWLGIVWPIVSVI